MLPPKLFSTYQRYKKDTDVVATWLASTALACGYSADLLKHPPTMPPSSSGRLKGKARKEAKHAKQAQNDIGERPKHIIAVAEFVTLAEFIASSKSPSASAPDSFIGALTRVISLRSNFRDRMYAERLETNLASDEQHGYFVQILEQVRTILKPIMAKSQPGTSQPASLPIFNTFEALRLYEPFQTFLDAPAPPKPDHNEPLTSDTYEAEQSAAREELKFVWVVMLNDLRDLRRRIMQIWSHQRDGQYDAATAALATNTAIDLARSIIDEVLPLTIPHGGVWHVACVIYALQCSARGLACHTDGSSDNFNYETYDIAEASFIWVYEVLESFNKVLKPREMPVFRKGALGVYDPGSDRRTKTGEEKAQEDEILLTQLFAEQSILIRAVPNYPVEDEFLRGVRELDRTREVLFYLAFAAQVHLDIHHVLRADASRPCKSLLQASLVFDDEITAQLDFHKSFNGNPWPASYDTFARSVQKEIRWIHSDPIRQAKATALKETGIPSAHADLGPQLLLSWSPVVAGLMLFRFRAQSWKLGMAITQSLGSILHSAQLYNALVLESSVTMIWQDMEIAQTIFNPDHFYVGNRPRSRPEYLSKFCLNIGMSAALFTKSGKAGGRKVLFASKAGPRCLEGDAAVSRMFFARYLENSGQLDWTSEYVNEIISRSSWDQKDSKDGYIWLIQTSKPLKTRRQEAAKRGPFSPSELIHRLSVCLHAESMELSFLYLKMHRQCWRFLLAIRAGCDPILRQVFGPGYLEKESKLPYLLGWIFKALNGCCGIEQAETLLQICVHVVEEMATHGGHAVRKAIADLGFSIRFPEI